MVLQVSLATLDIGRVDEQQVGYLRPLDNHRKWPAASEIWLTHSNHLATSFPILCFVYWNTVLFKFGLIYCQVLFVCSCTVQTSFFIILCSTAYNMDKSNVGLQNISSYDQTRVTYPVCQYGDACISCCWMHNGCQFSTDWLWVHCFSVCRSGHHVLRQRCKSYPA